MLISAEKSCLLVVDVQEKLAPAMAAGDKVIENIRVLMTAASKLASPILVSEQYPKGLGPTIEQIASLSNGNALEKISFSCMADEGFAGKFHKLGRRQAVIAGIEAHVCVLQTAMQLLDRGCKVFVVADATTSRTVENHQLALQRLQAAGAKIVSTEMVLFEWLERADNELFKEISQLIK